MYVLTVPGEYSCAAFAKAGKPRVTDDKVRVAKKSDTRIFTKSSELDRECRSENRLSARFGYRKPPPCARWDARRHPSPHQQFHPSNRLTAFRYLC